MGGSDQWGNIVNGIDLGRRMSNVQLFALTSPLITTSSGAKMGKTAAGAVWLNADQKSPYDYWQFWRNTEDKDVGRFLRLFTDLPMDEIARLEKLSGSVFTSQNFCSFATALPHLRPHFLRRHYSRKIPGRCPTPATSKRQAHLLTPCLTPTPQLFPKIFPRQQELWPAFRLIFQWT
jgi:hypothetical protein